MPTDREVTVMTNANGGQERPLSSNFQRHRDAVAFSVAALVDDGSDRAILWERVA